MNASLSMLKCNIKFKDFLQNWCWSDSCSSAPTAAQDCFACGLNVIHIKTINSE